ncbi:MAG: hypothetical protein HW421_2173 [Ignavibacteria bacterium]|nr:hypothetical protein [Ignavibacteria bacterium]
MKIFNKIAIRYIFSLKSFHFISVITLISILGITVGVAALICVLSIFNGFGDFTEGQVLNIDPHLRIISKQNKQIKAENEFIRKIKSIRGVSSVQPQLSGRAVIMSGANIQAITLSALNPENIDTSYGIPANILLGRFHLKNFHGMPAIVIGAGISDRSKLLPGDTITIVTPKMLETSIAAFAQPIGVKAIVSGIFRTKTNIKDNEMYLCIASEQTGRKIFGIQDGSYTYIDIRLNDKSDAESVTTGLSAFLTEDMEIQTWKELNSELYHVMEFERMAVFVVLSLIISIAVFNILASLSMTVVEKRRDIALLKALGAIDGAVRNIFIYEGIIIGAIGVIAGAVIGLSLCFGQQQFGWFKLDLNKSIIANIPVSVSFFDISAIILTAMFLSLLATIYPSRRASHTIISAGLRGE